ncbi:MAG: cupin domain-containing protein, partial [Lachnospiraceae bacterium]|nr:cupin domain-containing protein [Lachnospiraceae bacterium]
QRMYRMIRTVDPDAAVTIATSKTQVSAINNQLGEDVGVSIEPCRRDTFPAIALATAYLADVMHVPTDEAVVVCPVDPYVEEDYFAALKTLCERAASGSANLVLMGMEPTYPSEKYGYIMSGLRSNHDTASNLFAPVLSFKEKPDIETAKSYLAQGALWNGGVFAYKLSYVLDKAHELIDFTDYNDLFAKYETLTKISFDYAVVEKESSIEVMRFSGQWKDLGTWNTLTEAMEEPVIGEAVLNDKCEDVHVINELNVPVLAMGIKNAVICASAQGILVSDKEQSSYIKPFVDKIDDRIMFSEKSWGSYRVIAVEEGSMTVMVTLNPGHGMHYHSHKLRDEVWTVISGTGTALIDDETIPVRPGDVLTMKAGQKHKVEAETELKIIEVQIGDEISVQDKEKY